MSNIELNEIITARHVALMASFTVLVFLSTSLFSIALVASTGFFNLGEGFIYIAALIGGPLVGAVAGGFGSGLADVVLGYGAFAPGTFVIKGLEGLAVGLLYQESKRIGKNFLLIFLGVISTFLILFSIFVTTPLLNGVDGSNDIIFNFGSIYTLGEFIFATPMFMIVVPGILLVFLAIALSAILWFVGLRYKEKGQMAIYTTLAGMIIVLGYFVYEVYILGLPREAAIFEVPFNIAQVFIGTVIAIPVVVYLRELGIISDDYNRQH